MKSYKITLIAALALSFSALVAPAYTIHKVKRGESLFGVANRYNVTPEEIIALNPEAQYGLNKIKELKIPEPGEVSGSVTPKTESTTTSPEPMTQAKTQQSTQSSIYVVQADDKNMVQVSKKLGIDLHQLIDLNPFADPDALTPGTALRLDDDAPIILVTEEIAVPESEALTASSPTPSNTTSPAAARQESPQPAADDGQDDDTTRTAIAETNENEQSVLILLPFMAEGTQPRHAQLTTDFYKGFLLAVNEKRGAMRYPLRITTDDTENSAGVLSTQLNGYRYDGISMIIPPEESTQFETAAEFGKRNDIYVLNVFNIKDESYLTNPYMIQTNIPLSMMYDKAADMILDHYEGYIPVILDPIEGKTEKMAFVNVLRTKCDERGIEVKDLPFEGNLELTDFSSLDPEQKYIFIPKSGALNVFSRFAKGLSDYMEQSEDQERIKLFGYPDWITFRGDNLQALKVLGATYYSRVYFDATSEDAEAIERDFRNWYGEPMINAVPNQGMLGYDCASMIVKALGHETIDEMCGGDGFSYDGIQSAFKFIRIPEGGLVNSALYIVDCSADGVKARVI